MFIFCVYVVFVYMFHVCVSFVVVFFFQAEDGIRDAQESRGLGDVYKRQFFALPTIGTAVGKFLPISAGSISMWTILAVGLKLSLIHI